MNEIVEKAKGVCLATGLFALFAWPFLALALTVYAGN